MNYPASIPVIFGTAVDKCRTLVLQELQAYNSAIQTVNYIYAPEKEMRETLVEMKKGRTSLQRIFPLIWLWERPIDEDRTGRDGFYAEVSLNVFIMHRTKNTYKSHQREEQVFDPILRPIYWNLLKAISQTVAFNMPDETRINHTKRDHKFLGMNEQAANWISEYVDAIELANLQLTINYADCVTPITFENS